MKMSKNIACALMALGLKKGDCAAIIGDNSPEWVYASVGIQCCGAGAAGVYATNAWQQVEYVVSNADAKFLFVENEEQLDKWLHFRDNVPAFKEGHRLGHRRPAPVRRSHGDVIR